MRDGAILAEIGGLENKVGHDVNIMHRSVTLCRTRIDAIEKVLFGFRGSLLLYALVQIFAPKFVEGLVERWHGVMIEDYNRKLDEVRKKKAKAIVTPDKAPILQVAR